MHGVVLTENSLAKSICRYPEKMFKNRSTAQLILLKAQMNDEFETSRKLIDEEKFMTRRVSEKSLVSRNLSPTKKAFMKKFEINPDNPLFDRCKKSKRKGGSKEENRKSNFSSKNHSNINNDGNLKSFILLSSRNKLAKAGLSSNLKALTPRNTRGSNFPLESRLKEDKTPAVLGENSTRLTAEPRDSNVTMKKFSVSQRTKRGSVKSLNEIIPPEPASEDLEISIPAVDQTVQGTLADFKRPFTAFENYNCYKNNPRKKARDSDNAICRNLLKPFEFDNLSLDPSIENANFKLKRSAKLSADGAVSMRELKIDFKNTKESSTGRDEDSSCNELAKKLDDYLYQERNKIKRKIKILGSSIKASEILTHTRAKRTTAFVGKN